MPGARVPGSSWDVTSGRLAGEGEVRDTGRGGDGLDVEGLLDALEAVPETDAAAEHDRDLDEVHVVDEPSGQEVADDGGATTDPDVLARGGRAGRLERLGRGGLDEVKDVAALHLDGGAGVVGEDEDRRVEGRVGAPPALPVRVVVPAGRAEL